MKHFFICLCLSGSSYFLCAQQTVDVSKTNAPLGQNNFFTAGGTPFLNVKFVKLVEGTPYFRDQWYKGTAIGDNDYEYKDLTLKLDLYDKQILYLDKGKEYVAATGVKEMVLTDSAGNNYKFVRFDIPSKSGKTTSKEWYQWLVSGKASLYKEYKKSLLETKAYSSPVTEQKIITKENYLIYLNGVFIEAKKIKEVPSILADKKKELEDYLKNVDDDKASLEDRFVAIINHYNSLVKDSK